MTAFWTSLIWSKSSENRYSERYCQVQKPGNKFSPKTAFLDTLVKNLLNDPKFTGLAQQLYTHGLVDGISQEAANPAKPNRLPSYIPSNTFALALLDIIGSQGLKESWSDVVKRRQEDLVAVRAQLKPNPTDADQQKVKDAEAALEKAKEALSKADEAATLHEDAAKAAEKVAGPKDFINLRAASTKLQQALAIGRALAAEYPDPLGNLQRAIEKLPGGHTKESLFVLLDKTKRETTLVANQIATAQHQAERLQANVEQWFNDAMDRVGGWYKRWTQKILLVIAVIVVIAANADTFTLAWIPTIPQRPNILLPLCLVLLDFSPTTC